MIVLNKNFFIFLLFNHSKTKTQSSLVFFKARSAYENSVQEVKPFSKDETK
jgi:hypothetical protein